MNELLVQRLIAALEANTAALQERTRSEQIIKNLLSGSAGQRLTAERKVTIPKAAKETGLSPTVVRQYCLSGVWPSEGQGRNRRVLIDRVLRMREEQAATTNFEMA